MGSGAPESPPQDRTGHQRDPDRQRKRAARGAGRRFLYHRFGCSVLQYRATELQLIAGLQSLNADVLSVHLNAVGGDQIGDEHAVDAHVYLGMA